MTTTETDPGVMDESPAEHGAPDQATDEARLTRYEHLSEQLQAALVELDKAQAIETKAKQEAKAAKEAVERRQDELNAIARQLAMAAPAQEGFPPDTPFGREDVSSLHAMRLDLLTDPEPLSTSMLETLREAGIETIGDVQAACETDEWWHKLVPGFGKAGRDKVDACIEAATLDWCECRDEQARQQAVTEARK